MDDKFKNMLKVMRDFPHAKMTEFKTARVANFRVSKESGEEGDWFPMSNKNELLEFFEYFSADNVQGEKLKMINNIFNEAMISDGESYYVQYYN